MLRGILDRQGVRPETGFLSAIYMGGNRWVNHFLEISYTLANNSVVLLETVEA